ncbi:pulmonary surfactant-associated protein C [Geospiza fortis]|uniref:Surfactant protein C n=1 Tax=Geospiza fortis TaxID=48883 RepID=A0A6I9ZDY3_GEOFO|nr:pulmonary surfactant-associated protein C [Geospiza fortis]
MTAGQTPRKGPRRFCVPSLALCGLSKQHKWHSAAGAAPALPGHPGCYKCPRARAGKGTGAHGEMEDSSKEALMEEAPPRYTESPRLPCIPHELKSLLLMVALVVVALVVVNVTFLLLGLHLSESHAETVLRMSIHGLDGEGSAQELAVSRKERSGTFAVRDGLNGSAAVVYDYSRLLVGYRSWRHRACYITRVDKDNFPGLDAVTETFQRQQDKDVGDKAVPLADRSILGTTINILCSAVPVFWEIFHVLFAPCHIKQLQVPELAKGHEPAPTPGTATAGCSTLEAGAAPNAAPNAAGVLLVVIVAVALLMRLSVEQRHADTVLRGGSWEEDAATFYLDSGDGNAATVIYDYTNLLVSYRARLHRACYVTRVDQDNIPGLDSVVETFQRRQMMMKDVPPAQAEDKISAPLADRSLLGTTAGILCSLLPVYWA